VTSVPLVAKLHQDVQNQGLADLACLITHDQTQTSAWSSHATCATIVSAYISSHRTHALLKALVWFWIIDETLVLTSIISVCRLNEAGTCQVMEQVMIMVMMVMTTR